MIPLLMSTILTAAPIPKASGYEGHIAVMIRGPQSEILLLNPSGNEVKRVPLKDLNGTPYSIKLARGGESILVTTLSGQAIMVGNRGYSAQGGYFLSLKGEEKPKELFERKGNLKLVLNRDATHVYGCELDAENAANAKQGELPTKAWRLELKTMKYEPIALPAGHLFIDISQDDETMLTQSYTAGKYRAATMSTKNWKPKFISESSDYPHGLSPDGRKVFLQEYTKEATNGIRLLVHDIATNDRKTIEQPDECNAISAYSFGADSKRVAFVGYTQNQNPFAGGVTYRIYVCQTDGTNRKMIFEAKAGEMISDIDWR